MKLQTCRDLMRGAGAIQTCYRKDINAVTHLQNSIQSDNFTYKMYWLGYLLVTIRY